ncbi:MAG TPA: permease-like cell division protein FtsX [Actinomycetota bacterium]|nr:permease-like cell division protein FtsX [Actinomycetota bacterium]
MRRIEYYFKETFQGLKRNGLLAFAAVSTAFIALFLLGMALLVRREVDLLIEATYADVEISVFLQDKISPTQQQHLDGLIRRMPEVASVDYESKAEAYQRAKEVIFRNEPEVIRNVSPDAFPASFRVKLEDPKQFRVVDARLQGQPGIDQIVDHRDLLERLFSVTAVFRVGMFAVAVIMLVSAAALIGNTVRMAVFARRKEIGIMRLVGATNWHIRVPFLIEGIIEGLLGAAAAIVGLFIMKVWFFDDIREKVRFLPWLGTQDVVAAIPYLLIAGVLVAAVASLLAMRRFLEV